jgi:hypothetical protein
MPTIAHRSPRLAGVGCRTIAWTTTCWATSAAFARSRTMSFAGSSRGCCATGWTWWSPAPPRRPRRPRTSTRSVCPACCLSCVSFSRQVLALDCARRVSGPWPRPVPPEAARFEGEYMLNLVTFPVGACFLVIPTPPPSPSTSMSSSPHLCLITAWINTGRGGAGHGHSCGGHDGVPDPRQCFGLSPRCSWKLQSSGTSIVFLSCWQLAICLLLQQPSFRSLCCTLPPISLPVGPVRATRSSLLFTLRSHAKARESSGRVYLADGIVRL